LLIRGGGFSIKIFLGAKSLKAFCSRKKNILVEKAVTPFSESNSSK